MLVLSCLFAAALTAAALTLAAARRWPRLDLAAPKIDASSDVLQHEVRVRPRLRSLLRSEVDPATATALVLTVALVLVAALAVGVGSLLLMIRTHSGLARFDLSVARWGADHATSTSTSVLRGISNLGGTVGVLVVAALVGVIEFRRVPNRAIPGMLALTVIGQFAVAGLIKAIVARPRPAVHQLTGFSGTSFPSGHATAAAATFAVAALLLGRRRSRRTRHALAAAAVGIAVLVAGTRVLLGVHWFTDVLAGIAIGWAWTALCSIAFGGRLLRFGAPVAVAEQVAAPSTPSTA